MKRFLSWLCSRLPVHDEGHLYHADNSLYMGRWNFFRARLMWPRLHHIATPDLDRHLHDHPAHFLSIVLAGSYVEARPVGIDPCWEPASRWNGIEWEADLQERVTLTTRYPGSVAFRWSTDRHRIVHVEPGTFTLFIFLGGKRCWWGFYTPMGKIWWRDYPSVHDAGQLKVAA